MQSEAGGERRCFYANRRLLELLSSNSCRFRDFAMALHCNLMNDAHAYYTSE